MALATIGILSIGDMGLGVAKLLTANNYRVITNASDRSQATQSRAQKNSVELISTDTQLCNQSDYILSIVPPRDALATAKRIIEASSTPLSQKRANPLYFLDLNAISPRSAREIHHLFTQSNADVRFIDGGIIGDPPHLKANGSGTWYRPNILVSGPHRLSDARPSGEHLSSVLQVKHINENIGSATGLKMCFASLSKGFTALAIQSFTTAHNLGVVEELKENLDTLFPEVRQRAERGMVGMPPKAYRWVREMEEIADTFEEDGGFSKDESIFGGIARVYDLVANGTELGNEITEHRVRGKTAEDVATLMAEGIFKRKS